MERPLPQEGEPRRLRIFGGGLAGLALAVSVQEELRGWQVTLVDKRFPQSNTQLSGMRFREGVANRRTRSAEEILELLTRRTGAGPSKLMEKFAQNAAVELRRWESRPDFVGSDDRPDWFGPQWGAPNRAGKGRGKSTLDWLRRVARHSGVAVEAGELRRLHVDHGSITGAEVVVERDGVRVREVQHASAYVLANGSSTGLLFESTNRTIDWAAHEVAFASGLPLVGATVHMIHPFGNADSTGAPRIGCLETDLLAGAEVHVSQGDGTFREHPRLTELLAKHEAHYHFPDIVRELSAGGGTTRLDLPDLRRLTATVAEHYYHIGVEAEEDGVSIAGTDNGFAVGDASGIVAWTDYQERFPGFALTKCLIDARVVTDLLSAGGSAGAAVRAGAARGVGAGDGVGVGIGVRVGVAGETVMDVAIDVEDKARSAVAPVVRRVNSSWLRRILSAGSKADQASAACEWAEQAMVLAAGAPGVHIAELSFGIAMAHVRRFAGIGEPIRVQRLGVVV
jgi:hypothetical protein